MSILIDERSKIIIQGITGFMAQVDVELNLKMGVNIVAGVTPGKGGTKVKEVPVFNTMDEALQEVEANTSVVYVPAAGAKNAVIEAIDNDMKLVLIFTENIPRHDFFYCLDMARKNGTCLIGPNSNGIMSPGKSRLGGLGGDKPERMFVPGNVGILSRSGGMAGEISWMLRKENIGISTCVSVGGDWAIGSTFKELLSLFEKDEQTDAVILFGEAGGGYEEEAAKFISEGGYSKPLIAYIAGSFIDDMPEGTSFGHSGALIEKGVGSVKQKKISLRDAGVRVAENLNDIPDMVKKIIS